MKALIYALETAELITSFPEFLKIRDILDDNIFFKNVSAQLIKLKTIIKFTVQSI
jgi:hypothetical protein